MKALKAFSKAIQKLVIFQCGALFYYKVHSRRNTASARSTTGVSHTRVTRGVTPTHTSSSVLTATTKTQNISTNIENIRNNNAFSKLVQLKNQKADNAKSRCTKVLIYDKGNPAFCRSYTTISQSSSVCGGYPPRNLRVRMPTDDFGWMFARLDLLL